MTFIFFKVLALKLTSQFLRVKCHEQDIQVDSTDIGLVRVSSADYEAIDSGLVGSEMVDRCLRRSRVCRMKSSLCGRNRRQKQDSAHYVRDSRILPYCRTHVLYVRPSRTVMRQLCQSLGDPLVEESSNLYLK
jgi:hypothetical protein